MECKVIRDPAGFARLEPEYRDLYARSSRATLYQSWEWIQSWWSTFGGTGLRSWLCGLRVFTFREGERLVGCAPLVVRRPGGLPLHRLEPIGVLRSDFMELVIEDGCEEPVLAAFEYSLAHSRSWDLLDLQQLPEDSPTLDYFRRNAGRLGCTIREQETCPYAPLPPSWDAYLKSLGKKHRYNVGYYRRLMERDFTFKMGRVEQEDLEPSMEELFRLHQLRWSKRRLPGALFSPAVREFHRRAARALLNAGGLDLYRLELDGNPVAMLYCFAEKGRGYYYLGGFDPNFSRYSVGTVLTAYAIQQSIARGHTVFDFLRGAEPYKYRWNVKERINYRVEWRRGSPGSHALYTLNTITRALERQAKRLAHYLEKSS